MAKELVYRVRIEYDSSEAARGAQTIDRSQEQAEEATEKTTQAIKRQQQAQERTANSTRNYQKAQSNANQTLFSFGDLLNDSQQFQFGFAQGTRAIGNNIGFAAEQFSQIQRRTGSFKGAITALGSSLLGPGGIILAINAAVTAITVFGDSLFDSKEKASGLKEEIEDLTSFLDDLSSELERRGLLGDDPFDIEQLEFQRSLVQENIESLEQGISNLQDQYNVLTEQEQNQLERLDLLQRSRSGLSNEQLETLRNLKRQARQAEVAQAPISDLREELQIQKDTLEELNTQLREQQRLQGEVQRQAARLSQQRDISQRAEIDVVGVDSERQAVQSLEDQILTLPQQFRNVSEQIKQIKEDEVSTRINLEQQALSTMSSLAQAIAPRNKALALSLIAIEKGLKIAQVVADGTQKAAAATSQGLLYLSNPVTAPLASQAFSAAASIKANTAAAVATIAAQGIAEGITAASRIGGSGGRGSPAAGSRAEGFQTQNIERNQATSGIQSSRQNDTTVNVSIQTEADNRIVSKKAETGRKQRVKSAVRIGSD